MEGTTVETGIHQNSTRFVGDRLIGNRQKSFGWRAAKRPFPKTFRTHPCSPYASYTPCEGEEDKARPLSLEYSREHATQLITTFLCGMTAFSPRTSGNCLGAIPVWASVTLLARCSRLRTTARKSRIPPQHARQLGLHGDQALRASGSDECESPSLIKSTAHSTRNFELPRSSRNTCQLGQKDIFQ